MSIFDNPKAKALIDDFLVGQGVVKPMAPEHSSTGQVTVKELDELGKYIFDQVNLIEAMEKLVTEENKKLAAAKCKMVLYLKELGREDYKTDAGSLSISNVWRVNLPQTDEDKAKLFGWLKEKGVFEKYATVHSASLNSLYNAEWDAAKQRGEGLNFAIPGVPEPKLFEALKTYKARKAKE